MLNRPGRPTLGARTSRPLRQSCLCLLPVAPFLFVVSANEKPAPDISTVPADLEIPEVTHEAPASGKRVFFSVPGEPETTPPCVVYLPTDWDPEREKPFPVLLELAGNGNFRNAYGDVSTGRPEGSKLGYGLSGGQGFVWISLPYLNQAGDAVAITWWGDPPERKPERTVAFLKRAVPALCERFQGDPDRVILCGFSRGAIAANAIGLHDDEIAKLWRGFVCYSHYDGVREGWPFAHADRASAMERLKRLGGRPQLICHETTGGKGRLANTRRYLEETGIEGDFTFLETGFRNHNDAWTLRPSPARKAAREWLARVVAD